MISKLGLKRFPNNTIVGDIYSDGDEVIYYWLSGFACRSAEVIRRTRESALPQMVLMEQLPPDAFHELVTHFGEVRK